ncbi:ATP-binding protein [Vreelandella massiliensis]|uniref:ATP-binding protein n=1 Tax=Vreelandella massiliensis TaxID=1816686 RepID=UPI00096A44E7|nr:ATP-binding protein [Halomonas massiliensis]MYL22973.1 HAMP domain-containing protein [Halomonas alkaliantarctica]
MRWGLKQSAFLRFYLLLGMALLIIFVMALGGRMLIEKIRQEAYREELATFPMSLLVKELSPLSPRERQTRLDELAERLGMTLTLIPLNVADLSYFERARLERGQVLVEASPWRLRQRLNDTPWLIHARVAEWHDQQWQASIALAAERLAAFPPAEREAQLATLDSGSWPLTLRDSLPPGLTAIQQEKLAQGHVITRLRGEAFDVTLLTALPAGSGESPSQWLEAGPMERDELLPLNLHLPLLIGVMVVLTLVIYLIMRRIEARMARLELAATRIAGGRLETRVKVESGDFLGRVGMAFNAMANQVQSLLRGQQEMIRAVSHELRTPVARIRFAVQMVEDMTDQPAIRRQLQGIDADIAELDALVDEILTYARLGGETINGAEMEMSFVDCRAMAKRVLDTLSPLHDDLTLTLAPGPEIELLAEPRYLQRALQNLVSNACRYGHSQVEVRLWDEPNLVRIDVEDDGPGVPVESRGEIFKPFARLDDSRTRSSGGYGLGLSIVQKIMSGHGGSISVDASPTLGGARFTLLIPRREPPA